MLELRYRRVDCLKIKQAKLRSPVSLDGASPVSFSSAQPRIGTTLLSDVRGMNVARA
jgi:hypothetical protein